MHDFAEDITNDGKKGKGNQRGDYTITSDMLVEILEESIRLFWQFVRADKQCSHAKLRRQKPILVDPDENAISEIVVELQKDLQKVAQKRLMYNNLLLLICFFRC